MSEPQICSVCGGEGFGYDDGEYDPRSRRCIGGRRLPCGHCDGTGLEPGTKKEAADEEER